MAILGSRDYDQLFKLLIIGDSGVGKSSLLLRFADNTFSPNFITTIGVDFRIRTITVNGQKVKLQIWDTAGQERFRTITSAYYRSTHGVIVVYDVTDCNTFTNVHRWLSEIEIHCGALQTILVGNKAEDSERRAVPTARVQAFAESLNIPFFETSAKENVNIDEMFSCITKNVLEEKLRYDKEKEQDLERKQPVAIRLHTPWKKGFAKKKCRCG